MSTHTDAPPRPATLDRLQRKAFHTFSRRFAVPMLGAGFGSLVVSDVTGSLLLLTTIDRHTGDLKRTPLGYAVVGGAVVVVSGSGPQAEWFCNALSDPRVEIVLPGTRLRGSASPVTDPARRRTALRALIDSMPMPSLMLGDRDADDDASIDELAARCPVLAITPTAVLPGPFDPRGWAPKLNTWLAVAAPVAVGAIAIAALRRTHR
ncbi:MAG: nitroreductase family deazaflavin-dependent oxidoreductase [Micrococcales bacterium]|nr:nitroreductase family deazaflavin-dependent oxidoreductase [Micrococcales bacterium]MCL2666987.1 nitroreductase family deazaflavin-dependent oxidoreductase [Micrococcales bacterium]